MSWQQEQAPLPSEVRRLFASYKEAVGEKDAGPNFMPLLWERIDTRRRTTYSFGRLTRAFVTAAAAICLLISAGIAVHPSSGTSMSYVDLLDDADEADVDGERL